MAPPPPRVFTIPASAPFVPTLIGALRDGTLIEGFRDTGDPLALASATIYLPTRRACRLAREVFLDVTKAEAAILPRIVPLGDIDEDELIFAEAVHPDALDIPDALGGLERRLLLTRLVSKWAASPDVQRKGNAPLVANSPASALALADALARLMDDMTTRQVSWDKLDKLVPDEHDQYWKLSLEFLKIAHQGWQAHLQEHGRIEPAARRDLLIEAERRRLQTGGGGPVIAAGSTGSMPATAALIETIAKLPRGAVVLPGLDTDLDDDAWSAIAGARDKDGYEILAPTIGHPQFAMQALLTRIGIARAEVHRLGFRSEGAREALVSEAMRPAATTDRWRDLADRDLRIDAALEHVSVIAAANAEEEALAIAVALRETLEHDGKTAALVTPDRALARRVIAALERWHVDVDDSGGDALADTQAGVFARLVALAALDGLEPVALLALLKHPLLRLGAGEGAHHAAIATLEQAVLRGPRPKPRTAGLAHALATFRANIGKLHRLDPRTRLTSSQLQNAADLVEALTTALKPLEDLAKTKQPLTAFAAAHREVIAALSRERRGEPVAFTGRDGAKLAEAFDEIADDARDAATPLPALEYPDLFRAMIAEKFVRRPDRPGVRVRIYGLLEARLQRIDRVVLGGLVEGVWPPETRSDPWLSRPMRRDLGLDLPERRISLNAHDFAQMLGADEVVLAYPAKLSGAPTVPARFIQRLAAVSGADRWRAAHARGAQFLAWARDFDKLEQRAQPVKRPEPKPARNARPTSLSVTEIETWLRDPYTIYARHILKLQPLDPVDTPPGARDRGTVIHEAIGTFTARFKDRLPDDPVAELIKLGEQEFAALEDFPEAKAFWWPRYLRIARWFAAFEAKRRADLTAISAEVGAKLEIPLGSRSFTLRTRADRIEHLRDGRYAILDYKTGRPPSASQVSSGLSPQLTLEGAILRAGQFEGIPQGASIAEFLYVSLRGGEPAGEPCPVEFKNATPDAKSDEALAKLTTLVTRFEDETQGYLSKERPMFMRRGGGDYDHLARVREWSLTGGEAEDEGDVE